MGPQGLRSAAQKYFAQTRDTGGPEGLLTAQAQGSTWARAEEGGGGRERVGVHVLARESHPSFPLALPPPLSLCLSLYKAFSTLAARVLMSETSAGADWANRRVRNLASESSSPVTLATGQATPRRKGEWSSAQSLGPAFLPVTAGSISKGSAARCLPSYLPGLSLSRDPDVLPSTFPTVSQPPLSPAPVPVTATEDRKRICVA